MRLTIGSQTLNLESRSATYSAQTTNATNKITALAEDENATITIFVNGAEHENGTAATWEDGSNAVEIKVINGNAQRVYAVDVVKS